MHKIGGSLMKLKTSLGIAAVLAGMLLASSFQPVHSASPVNSDSTGTPEKEYFRARFRDPEDGAVDLGRLISGGAGFIPLLMPVTEPAVGFGLAGALLYVHPSSDTSLTEQEARIPPSISMLGGGLTDNGTWAAALGHMGVWKQGKIRYTGAILYASANLDFYGTTGGSGSNSGSVSWNIKLGGTLQKIQFQVRPSLFIGAKYLFLNTKNKLGLGEEELEIPGSESESRLGGLGASAVWDGRDNIFTPNDGLFGAISATRYDNIFGSSFDYDQFDIAAFGYFELGPVVLGARLQGRATSDGAPFYALPFLKLRGVPAFRYLGGYTALGEIEPRWKVTSRWSLVGFCGAGRVASELNGLADAETIVAGGGGFRYLLVRKMGLAVGADIARGPEQTAFYIIIGSYWRSI